MGGRDYAVGAVAAPRPALQLIMGSRRAAGAYAGSATRRPTELDGSARRAYGASGRSSAVCEYRAHTHVLAATAQDASTLRAVRCGPGSCATHAGKACRSRCAPGG